MKTSNDENIRVVIADDHPIFRKGLLQVIQMEPDVEVVGEAGDGKQALEQIEGLKPEVAVLDIDMPGKSGFKLAEEIGERKLAVKIIFLTMYKEENAFNRALDLGVKGYLLKDSAVTDIVAGIRAVARGEHFISPAISSYLINRSGRATRLEEQKPGLKDLTPMERRILKSIVENKTSKQIAEELFISARTVDNHRTNIATKLDLHGSHALLKFAFDHKSELT
jgi:two-component system, NarL family, response regulator DegU